MLVPFSVPRANKKCSSMVQIKNGDKEEGNERKYNRKLSVSQSTYDMVMKDCVEAYLDDNPDSEGLQITQNFIVRRMAKKYIGVK